MHRQLKTFTSAFLFAFMAFALSLTTAAQAQDADEATHMESWSGSLDAGGMVLRLKLEIEGKADARKAVLISVDQGNARIPVKTISFEDGKLSFTTPMVNGSYTGDLSESGNSASGTWSQNGVDLPLELTKDEAEK